jgi:hypothetical protein
MGGFQPGVRSQQFLLISQEPLLVPDSAINPNRLPKPTTDNEAEKTAGMYYY